MTERTHVRPGRARGAARTTPAPPPRLGFLGTGWIGRHRMSAVLAAGAAEAPFLVDPDPNARAAALAAAPGAEELPDYAALLARPLDGVVIATPSAGHARQAIRALERGLPVFCQKPLGRSAPEVERVLRAARGADRRIEVDLSYRFVQAAEALRGLAACGTLGRVFAADLAFHNAYGPDRDWFYDARLSGGGPVMDLGIHLVDLLLWTLGFPDVRGVSARLHRRGAPVGPGDGRVEDHADVRIDLEGGAACRLACSWNLHAGRDAVIRFELYGTEGSARLSNVDGSFHDFRAEHRTGTRSRVLVEPPDPWGGRALVAWAERLRRGEIGFDEPGAEELVRVARTLDAVYRSAGSGREERP